MKPGEATEAAKTVPSLLFLDVDGVLNTSTMDGGCKKLHPKLMRRLASLVNTTKCGIVLTSTWRFDERYLQVLFEDLSKVGITSDAIVGFTPIVEPTRRLRQDGMYGAVQGAVELQRCQEILSWIDMHVHTNNSQQRWAILDDLDLVSVATESGDEKVAGILQGHVVRTNREAGLTDKNAESVLEILRENVV